MRLLLTSAGITNESIATALDELVDKPASETKVALIPTAANVEAGNKDWFVNQIVNLWQHGYPWVDLVDFSASSVNWQERLGEADILFMSGGNTFHLLDQARRTGFATWLNENIPNKVYVGVSAGSILVAKSIEVATIEPADPNLPGLTDLTGLGLVDFELETHCDEARFKLMAEWARARQRKVYALDDQSAVKVIDEKAEVVGEGKGQFYE
jgi:dipeptidase E